MSLSLELRGCDKFLRFLRDFPSKVRIAMEDASQESLRLIAQKAKAIAPRRTGRLRDSIRAEGFSVRVGVDYAKFVEYGTKKMKAKPFLRPSISESSSKVRDIFHTKIEDVLRKWMR